MMKNKSKQLISKILAIVLLISLGNCFSSGVALANNDVITFEKTYNKDGKFYMPVVYNGYSGSEATVSATLVNDYGEVVETFKTLKANPGLRVTYSKVFTKLSAGTYYLNIKCEFLFFDPLVYQLKITNSSGAAKLNFTELYQIFTDAGDPKEVFKFDYFNAAGKKINIQIFDQYGSVIYKSTIIAKYVNGNCTFYWDYYPSAGGLRVQNDIYIIKYWIDGQTPKQYNFEVNVGEG